MATQMPIRQPEYEPEIKTFPSPAATEWEQQSTYDSPTVIVLDKFGAKDMIEKTSSSKSFRVHAMVALTLSTVSFIIWAFQAFITNGWPWFVYVWGTFILSLSAHFYLFERPKKQYLQLHTVFFAVLNIVVFASWVFNGHYARAWFIEVLFATATVLGIHTALRAWKGSPYKFLYTATVGYALINVLCFITWMDTGKGFPWFLYTVFGLAIPLHVAWSMVDPSRLSPWKAHLGIFVYSQLILFFTWATAVMAFPWFFFTLLLWTAGLVLHTGYVTRFHMEGRPSAMTPLESVSTKTTEAATTVVTERSTSTRSVGISLQR